MSEIYFTIAGTNHHHGQEFIEPDMTVKRLLKYFEITFEELYPQD